MARGFNSQLGTLAHSLFFAWDDHGSHYTAQNEHEEYLLDELVNRGIAVHVHGMDYSLSPEYQ